MARSRSRKEVLLGCARGYIQLGRNSAAQDELDEFRASYGISEESFDLQVELLESASDWQGLVEFAHSVLAAKGKMHAGGWRILIFGLIRSGKTELAEKAGRNGEYNCPGDLAVRLEVLRALISCGRLHAARMHLLDSIRLESSFQNRLHGDPDFGEFLLLYASGALSGGSSGEEIWPDDGDEIR